MNIEECRIICTDYRIPTREKLFFRVIYETQLRPFEVLNLKIEDWDRNQRLITAVRGKQKTKPKKGNRKEKIWLPSTPRTALLSENTNEMLRTLVSNRKKGHIFVNEKGEQLSLEWFNERINHYAKIIGIQKIAGVISFFLRLGFSIFELLLLCKNIITIENVVGQFLDLNFCKSCLM